jgi:putative acetyltransferase
MVTDDYAAVRLLWEATDGVGLDTSDEQEQFIVYLKRNSGLSMVACDEAQGKDRIVGAVLCGQDGRRGDLVHLAVAIAYRRQGIGRRLVEECLARLHADGILKCNIRVYRENTEGQDFWRRLGYAIRGDLAIMQRATGAST